MRGDFRQPLRSLLERAWLVDKRAQDDDGVGATLAVVPSTPTTTPTPTATLTPTATATPTPTSTPYFQIYLPLCRIVRHDALRLH